MNRIEQLLTLLEERKKDCFLHHVIGLEYVKQQDDHQARIYFENVLKIDPKYIGTYYHLGKLLQREGMREEALAMYQKGMDVAKHLEDGHSFNELGAAWEDLCEK